MELDIALNNGRGRVFRFDLADTAENILDDGEGDPSYAIAEKPSLEKELEGVPGEAEIRGPETPEIRQEYDDTWSYLSQRLEESAFDQVGIINPLSHGTMPRTFVLGYLDDEMHEVVDGEKIEYASIVKVFYDDSWDESRVSAEYISPNEMIVE